MNYWNLPLPNEVINLAEVDKIKFYNISFREYIGIYDKYIIGVYPFSIKIDNALKDGMPITYDDLKMYGVKSSHHHHDFLDGNIDIDPCDIYEKISGVKTHQGAGWPDDIDDMNRDYTDNIKDFESEIISHFRDIKIDKIFD